MTNRSENDQNVPNIKAKEGLPRPTRRTIEWTTKCKVCRGLLLGSTSHEYRLLQSTLRTVWRTINCEGHPFSLHRARALVVLVNEPYHDSFWRPPPIEGPMVWCLSLGWFNIASSRLPMTRVVVHNLWRALWFTFSCMCESQWGWHAMVRIMAYEPLCGSLFYYWKVHVLFLRFYSYRVLVYV